MRARQHGWLGTWSPSLARCISNHVFPVSFLVATPSAGMAMLLQFMFPDGSLSFFGEDAGLMKESAIWSTFTFLLGILVVFRTSQCYARWWEGSTAVFTMRAEWFDAVATLNIFISYCGLTPSKAQDFKERLVRLMSLLHATSLAELERVHGEDSPERLSYTYELISNDELDEEGIRMFADSHCKVELVYGWILSLIMDNVECGVLTTPSPLLTRAFQELANGLVGFHSALRLVDVPFPLVYAQTCNGLLLLHMLIVPVITSQWTTHPVWAGLFSFIQVFVMNLLNRVADGLANPFGIDPNDIDGTEMQIQMNKWLSTTLDPGSSKAPAFLSAQKCVGVPKPANSVNRMYQNAGHGPTPSHSDCFEAVKSITSGGSGAVPVRVTSGGTLGVAHSASEAQVVRGPSDHPPAGVESFNSGGHGRGSANSHLSVFGFTRSHPGDVNSKVSVTNVDVGDPGASEATGCTASPPHRSSQSADASWEPIVSTAAKPLQVNVSMALPGSVVESGVRSGGSGMR